MISDHVASGYNCSITLHSHRFDFGERVGKEEEVEEEYERPLFQASLLSEH